MCKRATSRVAFGKPVSAQTVTQERIAEFYGRDSVIVHPPVQVDGEDADGLARDAFFRVLGIDGVGVVDVAEDRLGADVNHRLNAGERGERRHQHLIARLEPLRHVQQVHCGCPGAGQHYVRHVEVRRELLFEFLAFRPEDVIAALDDVEDAAVNQLAVIDARKRNFGGHE